MDVAGIRAGKAYVEIGADTSKFIAGLNKAAEKLRKFGEAIRGMGLQMAGAGAAVFAPLAAAGKTFAEMGDHLAKASERTGASVESLSTLGYAAAQSGSNMDALEDGLKHMSKTMLDAAQGGMQAKLALRDVGLSVEQLNGLSQEDRFKMIANGLAGIKDPAVRAAAAMAIFSRGGTQLLPMMQDGAKGIEELQQRARDLGLQWTTQDAKAAEEFGDRMDDLWTVLKNGAAVIGSAVAPVMRQMAIHVMNAAIAATRFVREHRTLIATAAVVSAAVLAAGTSIVVLGAGISAAGIAVGTLGSALGILGGIAGVVLSPLSLALTGTIKAMGLLGTVATNIVPALHGIGSAVLFLLNPFRVLPALLNTTSAAMGIFGTVTSAVTGAIGAILSPAVLVGAAVVGLGGYFLYTSGVAAQAMGAIKSAVGSAGGYVATEFGRVMTYLKGVWAAVKADAVTAFDGIKDALSAGDWSTAAQILWTTIKLEFNRGMQGLWDPLLTGFYHVSAFLQNGWTDLSAGVQTIFSYLQEYLSNWDGVKTAVEQFWNWYKHMASAVIDYVADHLSGFIVNIQTKSDVYDKFFNKRLTKKDTDEISRIQYGDIEDQVAARRPDLSRDSDAFKALMKTAYERLKDYNAKNMVGQKLSGQALDQLADEQSKSRMQNAPNVEATQQPEDERYQQQMDKINADYAAKHADQVKTGEADRKKIEADRVQAQIDNEKRLEAEIAKIDPSRVAEIAALEKQLQALREKAAAEAKKAKEQEPSPLKFDQAGADDLLTTAPATHASFGAFNVSSRGLASEIFGNGSTSAAERTAKATEQTEKNTRSKFYRAPLDHGMRPLTLDHDFRPGVSSIYSGDRPADFFGASNSITPEMSNGYAHPGSDISTPFGDMIRSAMANVKNIVPDMSGLLPSMNAALAPLLGPLSGAALQGVFGGDKSGGKGTEETARNTAQTNKLLEKLIAVGPARYQ